MAKIYEGEIPFDHHGEFMNYADPRWEHVTWKPNDPFPDTMRFEGFERGRSAAHAIFISETTKQRYSMFLTHLSELILSHVGILPGGVVRGKWAFAKRGSNYGLIHVI